MIVYVPVKTEVRYAISHSGQNLLFEVLPLLLKRDIGNKDTETDAKVSIKL